MQKNYQFQLWSPQSDIKVAFLCNNDAQLAAANHAITSNSDMYEYYWTCKRVSIFSLSLPN